MLVRGKILTSIQLSTNDEKPIDDTETVSLFNEIRNYLKRLTLKYLL